MSMMIQEHAFEFNQEESFPHLASAPIEEAVIHWVARSTVPFRKEELEKQLAGRLSDYPERQQQQQLEIETRFDADGSTSQIQHSRWHGFRLVSADKKYIAQFFRDGIVFSQ